MVDDSQEVQGGLGQLGAYELLAELSRGALSTVFLARRRGAAALQRTIAIKRLRPEAVRDAAAKERFLDEARLVSSIHHANVVGVLDVSTDDGCYLVMDYVDGASFDALLSMAGPHDRDPRHLLPIVVDALSGLQALHTAHAEDGQPWSIVHQAPRARHVLVGVDGCARIADFGQLRARKIPPSPERNQRLWVGHSAPEHALDPDNVDARADLFIVGIMLWEALTGESLFARDTPDATFQHMLHRRVPPPSQVGRRPPACFDEICLRALDRNPAYRYASAAEMAWTLRETAVRHGFFATPPEVGAWVKRVAAELLLSRRLLLRSQGLSLSRELALDDSGERTRAGSGRRSTVKVAPAKLWNPDGSGAFPGVGPFPGVGFPRGESQASPQALMAFRSSAGVPTSSLGAPPESLPALSSTPDSAGPNRAPALGLLPAPSASDAVRGLPDRASDRSLGPEPGAAFGEAAASTEDAPGVAAPPAPRRTTLAMGEAAAGPASEELDEAETSGVRDSSDMLMGPAPVAAPKPTSVAARIRGRARRREKTLSPVTWPLPPLASSAPVATHGTSHSDRTPAVIRTESVVDSVAPPPMIADARPPPARRRDVPTLVFWGVVSVLSCIILLALGVGFKSWLTGPSTAELERGPAEDLVTETEGTSRAARHGGPNPDQASPTPAAIPSTPPVPTPPVEPALDPGPVRPEPAPEAAEVSAKRARRRRAPEPAPELAPEPEAETAIPNNPY